MKYFLGVALFMAANITSADNTELKNADCTQMKTYKLREECLAAQGKTEEDLRQQNRQQKYTIVDGVTKYKTAKDLFEHINIFEFSAVNNKGQIDIALFPQSPNPLLGEEEAKRAILDGVYRTFIHTDAKCIELTVIPLTFLANSEPNYKQQKKLHICRDKALHVLQNNIGIASFEDMIVTPSVDGFNQWNNNFVNIYYGEKRDGSNIIRNKLVNALMDSKN